MKRDGFTLIEIIIALSLMGIILITIYQAFSGHVKAIEACREVEDRFQIGRTALDILFREIEGAYLGPEGSPCGFIGIMGKTEDGLPQDRLHFLTTSSFTADRGWAEGRIREISYWIMNDPETGESILMRREDTTPDEDCQGGGKEQIVSEGIKGIEFLFVDKDGREVEEWDSRINRRLPVAVRVTILVSGREDEGLELSTWIPIPLSSGLERGMGK